jgi:hypothetical protein
VVLVVDENVGLEHHGGMKIRCKIWRDTHIIQVPVYHLLGMKIDYAFCHFGQLVGSLSEHDQGVEFITD